MKWDEERERESLAVWQKTHNHHNRKIDPFIPSIDGSCTLYEGPNHKTQAFQDGLKPDGVLLIIWTFAKAYVRLKSERKAINMFCQFLIWQVVFGGGGNLQNSFSRNVFLIYNRLLSATSWTSCDTCDLGGIDFLLKNAKVFRILITCYGVSCACPWPFLLSQSGREVFWGSSHPEKKNATKAASRQEKLKPLLQ